MFAESGLSEQLFGNFGATVWQSWGNCGARRDRCEEVSGTCGEQLFGNLRETPGTPPSHEEQPETPELVSLARIRTKLGATGACLREEAEDAPSAHFGTVRRPPKFRDWIWSPPALPNPAARARCTHAGAPPVVGRHIAAPPHEQLAIKGSVL